MLHLESLPQVAQALNKELGQFLILAEKLETKNDENIKQRLKEIDQSFNQLEDYFCFSPVLQEKIIFLIHSLIYAIQLAEEQGWSKEKIKALLPSAWRIHRQSSFVKHVQDWPRGHPGDFEAINMIVERNEKSSPNSIGGRPLYHFPKLIYPFKM